MSETHEYDPTGWAPALDRSPYKSSELVGELVALRPTRFDETISTTFGSNEATWCEALVVDPSNPGTYRNLGELPIFWEAIRRQLPAARPWVAGRIVQGDAKPGRNAPYLLQPPTSREEADAISQVLKRHASNDALPVEPVDDSEDTAPF